MTEPKHGLTCIACEGDISMCGCYDEEEDENACST